MNETYSNRCRACAGQTTSTVERVHLHEQSLSEMFTHCTSLKVASDDCLPSHICIDCFVKLKSFNDFRQSCINSDAYFREHIFQESMKEEDETELDDFDIKCEETDIDPENPEIKNEIYISACIDDISFTHDDSQSDVQSLAASSYVTKPIDPFDEKKFICDYCGRRFDKKNSIGSHMTIHRKGMESMECHRNMFTCTVDACGKVFETKRLLNSHSLKVHKVKAKSSNESDGGKKSTKINCPKCPKWSTIQHKIDAHIRSVHEGLKPYKCPHEDCIKEFVKYRSYEHHLKFKHTAAQKTPEKKEYRCSYDGCDMEYGLIDSLNVHIKRCHLGIIPVRRNQELVCDQCGETFVDGHSLKNHIFKHTGQLPWPCEICPKRFLTKRQLTTHTMRHLQVKPFECSVCGARKTTRQELKHHLNFHSKEISYPCKECPRVFTSYGAITRHVRIHHRNHKPYVCPHCGRTFAKADTMKNHAMTHTGEKPFACSICGHRFIQGVALKTHMRTHAKK